MIMASFHRVKISLFFNLLLKGSPNFKLGCPWKPSHSFPASPVDGECCSLLPPKPFFSSPFKNLNIFGFLAIRLHHLLSYLVYVIYWPSTPLLFNWRLQNLAMVHSTPKLLLVTSIITWMTYLILWPLRSPHHNHVQHAISTSHSTVKPLIISPSSCIMSKILILSTPTLDHHLLSFQLMYSSNSLISSIPTWIH